MARKAAGGREGGAKARGGGWGVKVAEERVAAGREVEAARLEKIEREILVQDQYRERAKHWGANVIQSAYRGYLAVKRARAYAYINYTKHFDSKLLSYYYIEKKTKKAQWTKPKILGTYHSAYL